MHRQFAAEGPKIANELINSNYSVDKIYALKEWLTRNNEIIQKKKISAIEVSEKELGRISGMVAPNLV